MCNISDVSGDDCRRAYYISDCDKELLSFELDMFLDRLNVTMGLKDWAGTEEIEPFRWRDGRSVEARDLGDFAKRSLRIIVDKYVRWDMRVCKECSRVYFLREDKSLLSFSPNEPIDPDKIFESVASTLPWRLTAKWDPSNFTGEICWARFGMADHVEEHSNFEKLNKRYLDVFDKLVSGGRICSALFLNGEKIVHQWNAEEKG